MSEIHSRREALALVCKDEAVLAETFAYCESPFRDDAIAGSLPMADEPHVADWAAYARDSGADVFQHLQEKLPQLSIPVRDGISTTERYSAVMYQGQPFDEAAFGGRFALAHPERLRLQLHPHAAGTLPVLVTSHRDDFVALLRALASRSEPTPVGAGVNAQMISGLINWDRVKRYRAQWAVGRPAGDVARDWPDVLTRVARLDPGRFYDRVILICVAPYSGLSASAFGLPLGDADWIDRSTPLRIEHEFAHYATKRLYGAMRLHLHDELIADFMGMTRALGTFRADWFLTGLGLERLPEIRPDGRVHVYRGGLGHRAFEVACALARDAARTVERVAGRLYRAEARGRFFIALTLVPLDRLALPGGDDALAAAYARAAAHVREVEAA